MTSNEFLEATKKLEMYYDKEYKTEQLKIMYERFQSFSLPQYINAINHVLGTSKYLPKIADILEANKENKRSYNTLEEEHTACDSCNGTGYVVENRYIEGHRYQFAHVCPNCDNAQEYDGRVIQDVQHRSPYVCRKYHGDREIKGGLIA